MRRDVDGSMKYFCLSPRDNPACSRSDGVYPNLGPGSLREWEVNFGNSCRSLGALDFTVRVPPAAQLVSIAQTI